MRPARPESGTVEARLEDAAASSTPSDTDSDNEVAEQPPKKKRPFIRELPVLIVVAFAIALLIKSFALQAFYIPSGSMEPTLEVGDRVLVEKVGYRFGEPHHGDVVVFEKDLAEVVGSEEDTDEPFWTDITNAFKSLFGFPTGGSQDFIKRVIGVEGDKVEGKDGRVWVNDEPIDEPYLASGTTTGDFEPFTVGDNEIFVMGDNRSNSDDSRNFGPVPVDSVVGRAFVLIWPPGRFGGL